MYDHHIMEDACVLHCVVFSGSTVCLDTNDDPLEVLKIQLQEFTGLLVEGNDGGRQISRKEIQYITHTHTHTHKHSHLSWKRLDVFDVR